MYRVFSAIVSDTIGNVSTPDIDTDNLSSVVDISAIVSGSQNDTVTVQAGATNGATLYFTGVPAFSQANNETEFALSTNLNGSSALKVGTYTPNLYYSNASGDTFFKVTGDANGTGTIAKQ